MHVRGFFAVSMTAIFIGTLRVALFRVALSSFRQLYDLLGDCVSGRATGPSACWRVTRAISKATPRRRAVSGSNLWPCK